MPEVLEMIVLSISNLRRFKSKAKFLPLLLNFAKISLLSKTSFVLVTFLKKLKNQSLIAK